MKGQVGSDATDATALKNQVANLTTQNQELRTQVTSAAGVQAASVIVPLVAQCDALSAYQYDRDRPSTNGWVKDDKDVRNTAEAVCQKALDTAGKDQKTQRRITVQIGRI